MKNCTDMLEDRAKEYVKAVESERGVYINYDDVAQAYKDGYEQGYADCSHYWFFEKVAKRCAELEKENEELKNRCVDQIRKIKLMRCCGNCKWNEVQEIGKPCVNCDGTVLYGWELRKA